MANKSVKVSRCQSKSGAKTNVSCSLKIVVLGGDNVGKSNLVERYMNDEDMNLVPNTIGGKHSYVFQLQNCVL